MTGLIVFPHQLFNITEGILEYNKVFLVEDPLFFYDNTYPAKYHKLRLMLHRASMKAYEQQLKKTGAELIYLEYKTLKADKALAYKKIKELGVKLLHYYTLSDFILSLRFKKYTRQLNITTKELHSPMFLTTLDEFNEVFGKKSSYLMATFYTHQRKRLNVLVNAAGQPEGGQWSFDAENRKPLPKATAIAPTILPVEDSFIKEAREYVEKHFSTHYGSTNNYWVPYTHQQAQAWLTKFIEERFDLFGPYEDAMTQRDAAIFHSVITPMLNIGLLTPKQVLDQVLEYYHRHTIRLNSVEGYVRQLIGWREFMHCVYLKDGVRQRNSNFFNHQNKLNEKFYSGTTGIAPVDYVIKQLNNIAYSHHIERLMVLSNFMLLTELNPTEVYTWFMEMYIDAYDWVMVPNVYGMGLYADGGILSTKPYISGSGYIKKMGDFSTKGPWVQTWNALYWRFLFVNREKLESNPRMGLMYRSMDRMDKGSLLKKVELAESYLQKLYK